MQAAKIPFFYGLELAGLLCGTPLKATPWPVSDIPPDPAVRLGVLPNGMRYAILKNQTPADAVSVRFSIDVGSTDEAADQRGFSHFVEHMAFRGSRNFPDGELNRSLERLGLRFGADTNASTSQYRTEFRFDLPNAKNVGEALAIARDVAGNVNFASTAVQTEAGVVMVAVRKASCSPALALTKGWSAELAMADRRRLTI
jgi:zinc protease